MGGDRNESGKVKKERTFTDDDICRTYLLGLCPNELFQNTKSDIGPCGKHHNEHLKEMFEKDPKADTYRRKWRGFLKGQLKQLLDTVNRRIEANQQRVAQEKERGGPVQQEPEKITALKEEMSERLKQAEVVADAGKYDDSKAIMKEVDVLKRRIEDLQAKRAMNSITKENVCDVCGLMVSAEESEDIRKYGRGWHTDGKQHLGFLKVREKMKELEEAHALDRKNGIRTPTPSPVRAPPRNEKRKRSRSLPDRKRDANRRTSRSPRRDKRTDDRRKKGSRSRSQRRGASRSRSPWNRKSDSKRHVSRSPRQRRERSPHKSARHVSPKRKSRSRDRSHHRSSPSVTRRRSKDSDVVREDSKAKDENAAGEESGKPVKFVLGLGKIPVSAVAKSESASAADDVPQLPDEAIEKTQDKPRRSRSRRRRKRQEAQEAAAAVAEQAPQTEEQTSALQPEKPEENAADPEPPKPVRFVLGLGKLNVSALKRR
mmetsp:Transcript_51666/g.82046  ORF Transcript_51666/g.82046 Transcript_51666/m.82046 type:complete len:486 (-) Transcript_51666:215-1672(-)